MAVIQKLRKSFGKSFLWLWALSFTPEMVTLWAKYMGLRRKHELAMAIVYTIMVSVMSGYHVYSLIASSVIL